MDVELNSITFHAQHMQVKDKKRIRRDSAKSKEHSVSASGGSGSAANGTKRSGKIGDRKSRSIYGRGLPKKGGAGGKGTWGRPGDEINQVAILDNHDPNYDSEELDCDTVFKTVRPEWSRDEIEAAITPILNEYFEHAEKEEVLESLMDVNIQGQKSLVIVHLITLAMERKSEFRELASQLLKFFATPPYQEINHNNFAKNGVSGQYRNPFLSAEDIKMGFSAVCENLSQLTLDTPDASEVCGKFIARAIFDRILSKDFLDALPKSEEDLQLLNICLKEAKCQLAIPHNNLKYIWGIGGGNQPIEVLKEKMSELLQEYLSSGDSEEAIRCVRDLDVPHYHHELVYELFVMAIEVSTKRAISMLVHLLKRFCDTAIVSVDQLNQGVVRVFSEISEISIDVPNAYIYLEEFVNMSYDLKIISLKLKVQAPKRTRKRFVSEGDSVRWNRSGDSYFDLV